MGYNHPRNHTHSMYLTAYFICVILLAHSYYLRLWDTLEATIHLILGECVLPIV